MAGLPSQTKMHFAYWSLSKTLTIIFIFPVQHTLTGCPLLNGAAVVSSLRTILYLPIFHSLMTVVTVDAFVLLWELVFGC